MSSFFPAYIGKTISDTSKDDLKTVLGSQGQQIHHLLVIGDRQGKRIVKLEASTCSIGRDTTNAIVLYSHLVSRQHALLMRMAIPETATYLFRLIDGNFRGKRSTNGLTVNGKRCFSHDLKHGDVIEFGRDVRAGYYATADLADVEFLTSGAEDVSSFLSNLSDPFQTLVASDSEREQVSESALVRLASFPELIAHPIVEIDLAGTITYLNPAATTQFPSIREVKLEHPILARVLPAVCDGQEKFFVREVEVVNKVFEQSVHYIAESDLIRSYIVDITERKQVEVALQQAHNELETKVVERTAELSQANEQLQSEVVERRRAEQELQEKETSIRALYELTLAQELNLEQHFQQRSSISAQNGPRVGTLPLILVVDDDKFTRLQLRQMLLQEGYRVEEVNDGEQCLAAYTRIYPDIVLIDAVMPVMDGFTCCTQLQTLPGGDRVPVLMITGLDDQASVDRAFAAGAADYVMKPIHWAVLRQRMRRLLQQSHLYKQLEEANQVLQHLAVSDSLTRVANRRRFDEYLDQAWWQMARERTPLSLVLCDIDFFKTYNDTYGHQAGDDCLRQVAKAISRAVGRPADLVARYGGEEFAVILPSTKTEGAVQVAEEIQTEVKALELTHTNSQISKYITLSLGVASTIPGHASSPATLIAAADQALYQAKAEGRDTLRIAMPAPSPEQPDIDLPLLKR
jgi:diguanylate cyclase (GGDEF)-like protein